MIPKNNFKSLHRKYYCLKFMIFKLQVEEFVLCGCHFKTHVKAVEARPQRLLQSPSPARGTPLSHRRAQPRGRGPAPQRWRPGELGGVSGSV